VTVAGTFRALHEAPEPFVIPNPWDVGSARILAAMGFKALATTSAGMAFARGQSDGTVSPKQVLSHCEAIVSATTLPVSADLEKGFGDSPESVADTILAASQVGLSGCSIEDHTGRPSDPIFEKALAVERIEAACEAARALPKDFVLTARCENLLWGRPDLDVVIERLQAYEVAGADVLFAPGLERLEDIRTVCSALSKPVNVIMETPGATFTMDELAEAGVKRVSVGVALAQSAYSSVVWAAEELMRGSFRFTDQSLGYDVLDALISGNGKENL